MKSKLQLATTVDEQHRLSCILKYLQALLALLEMVA